MIDAGTRREAPSSAETPFPDAQRHCGRADGLSLERPEAALLAQAQRLEAPDLDLGQKRPQALQARFPLPLARDADFTVTAIPELPLRD
jgi:hypothetical protein